MMIQATMIEVPLKTDSDGAIRVGGTRVLLERVIYAFRHGKTPESIVQSYPTLALEDVYAVIAYYLQHRDEVDTYIRQVEHQGEILRQQIEANQPDLVNIRERLIHRQRITNN